MTSNQSPIDQPASFWRDWYARIGLGLFLLGIIDLFIPDIFVRLGIWSRPAHGDEYAMFLLTFLTRFILLPILIGFFLWAVAAARLLRRKKIF